MTIGIDELPAKGIVLRGVALTGANERFTPTGLSLVFAAAGITVQATEPPSERLLGWRDLDTAWIGEQVTLADGRTAAILELWSAGERMEFLLASDRVDPSQVAYLRQAIPMWLNRYKVVPQSGSGPDEIASVAAVEVNANGAWRAAAAAGTMAGGATETPVTSGEPVGHAPALSQPATEVSAPEQPISSAQPPTATSDLVDPSFALSEAALLAPDRSADPAPSRSPSHRRRSRWGPGLVVVVVVVVILIGAVIYLLVKPASSSSGASPGAVALATSINLRFRDLPTGWVQTTTSSVIPPPASGQARLKAAQTLAACVRQPVTVIEGWLGTAAFPGQIAWVTSPIFQSGSVPTAQMFSSTRVIDSTGDSRGLTAAFEAHNFTTCYGQYQAAAAAPVTAQVEMMTAPAPKGVKTYVYSTTFTLPNQQTSVIEEAYIFGGRTTTVLQSSSPSATMTTTDFGSAYTAVVGRVAKTAG